MNLEDLMTMMDEAAERDPSMDMQRLLATKRLMRIAYKLGYQARQDELLANLSQAAKDLQLLRS